jgi:hypothetical protein
MQTPTTRSTTARMMSSQRHTTKQTEASLSDIVEFVLPGRRTLSEHLPSERIEVSLPLALRSHYLNSLIHEHRPFKKNGLTIYLHDVDAAGFKICVEWLKTHNITFHAAPPAPSGGGLLLRDAIDLIFAHMVGTKFDEPHFQDQVIDEMARVIDESQALDLKVMEVLFLEKGASHVLKQFVVDRMFAVERHMLRMIRGFPDDSTGGRDREDGCEYHVHEHGNCHRDDPEFQHGNKAAKVVSIADNIHENYDGITGSEQYNTRQTRPLFFSSSGSETKSIGLSVYNMPFQRCFGSEEWSQDFHGFSKRTFSPKTAKSILQKPLPPTPPLRPGMSLSPPSSSSPSPSISSTPSFISSLNIEYSPSPFQESSKNHKVIKTVSTKQLVLECLNRLQTNTSPTSSTFASIEENANVVPNLVLECLSRLNQQSAYEPFPTRSRASSDFSFEQVHHAVTPVRAQPPVQPSRSLLLPQFPPSVPPSYPAPSSPPLSRMISLPRSLPSEPLPHTHLTPPVRRKPAPSRGIDWLSQYNRVNAMFKSNVEVEPVKRSRRSRFVEVMRSESRDEYRG